MLKIDCIHFPGDRPCDFHKKFGIKCDDCEHYQNIDFKILIIKLDAIGDVLRTTSILPPLKIKFPQSQITWCTRINAKELFEENEFVNDIIFVEDDASERLACEEFDLVINLDTSKYSSSIAALANAKEKIGFVLSSKGYVEPTSKEALEWLEMSAFDDVKKANQKSYQQIMYDILNIDSKIQTPVLNIQNRSKEKIELKSAQWNLSSSEKIGLNIGVGTKWPSKGWPIEHWKSLIKELIPENYDILMLGGPEEKEKIINLIEEFPQLINTGTDNSIMEFASIVNMCDVIVTADSFALHVATALQKKIIVMFGSTSNTEIYLYGNGEKIVTPKECKCYYKRFCTEDVSCMQKITPSIVKEKIDSALKK
ncbi:MAG: glycosyltransferase family 9 protein [Nitrososphaeraceae archaeon]|nr:glycosyltransferase family 9 protein [Nitrososphaeraceae archaeon]